MVKAEKSNVIPFVKKAETGVSKAYFTVHLAPGVVTYYRRDKQAAFYNRLMKQAIQGDIDLISENVFLTYTAGEEYPEGFFQRKQEITESLFGETCGRA